MLSQAQHLRVIRAVHALKDDMLVTGTTFSLPETVTSAASSASCAASPMTFNDAVIGPKLQAHAASLGGWFEDAALGGCIAG